MILQISARIAAQTCEVNKMELKELIERLNDMKLLYGNAVIHVKGDQNEYRIKSVDGFMGEKRPNECRDPHVVVINVKKI